MEYKIDVEDLTELKESLTKLTTDLKAVAKAITTLNEIDVDELTETIKNIQDILKKAKEIEEE